MESVILLVLAIGAGIFAYRIKYRRDYNLIPGYKTMPKEQRQRMDIAGFANLMGSYLLALAGCMVVAAVLTWFNLDVIAFGVIILPSLSLPFVIAKARKFNSNRKK